MKQQLGGETRSLCHCQTFAHDEYPLRVCVSTYWKCSPYNLLKKIFFLLKHYIHRKFGVWNFAHWDSWILEIILTDVW